MSTAHLTIANVSKRFGSHQALNDVSLDVVAGESVVIVGPSGCGKTTLLRLIAGLDVPDSGEIWLAGTQVSGPRRALVPPHERGIGFVFQDLALWPHLTAQKNLDFVLESAKTPRADRRATGTGQVGTIRKYSDVLLIFLLKGLRPEKYRERYDARVDHKVSLLDLLTEIHARRSSDVPALPPSEPVPSQAIEGERSQ